LAEEGEPLDQPAHVVELVHHQLDGFSCHLAIAQVGAGEDLEVPAGDGQRCPQLMRNVRDQPLLGTDGDLHPLEHGIEALRKLADLVVGTLVTEPLVKASLAGGVGSGGDAADRAQKPAQKQECAHHADE